MIQLPRRTFAELSLTRVPRELACESSDRAVSTFRKHPPVDESPMILRLRFVVFTPETSSEASSLFVRLLFFLNSLNKGRTSSKGACNRRLIWLISNGATPVTSQRTLDSFENSRSDARHTRENGIPGRNPSRVLPGVRKSVATAAVPTIEVSAVTKRREFRTLHTAERFTGDRWQFTARI